MAMTRWERLQTLRWRCGGPKVAMAVALVFPVLPRWLWPVAVALLLATWSWLAFTAIAAGLSVRYPWMLSLWGGVGLAVASIWRWRPSWLDWTPRGSSLDPIRGRLNGIALACLRLHWRGRGSGTMRRDLRRWCSRGVLYLPLDALYCEPLQLLYEYGVLGASVLATALVVCVKFVDWGSTTSAAVVTLAVLSLGHAPFHYMGAWAKRQFRRLVPAPPLLADLTIHVLSDGTFRIYSDHQRQHSTDEAAVVAAAIVRAGAYIAEQHGLRIEQIGREKERNGK